MAESDCILAESCETLVSTRVCARAVGLTDAGVMGVCP
jgi:hypothetical protein